MLWVTEYVITYRGRPVDTVSIMEFHDGKPPAWRAQWVGRMEWV